jgi:hypothetical protein
VDKDYDIFVHLRDESGAIVAQSDRQPLSGLAPTSSWQKGDLIRDTTVLPLPANLAPGDYQLFVGAYLRETGERLSISGVHATDRALLLDSIRFP